jgi:hypothetical protein
MKEIKQTYQVTKYQAEDGTIFDSEKECEKYDESAKCVLLGKYNDLVIRQVNGYQLTNDTVGIEDYYVDVVKVNTKDDLDLVLQLMYFYNPLLRKEENRDIEIASTKKVNSALISDSHILFIGRGYDCDDCFSILSTKEDFINNIEDLCKEDNQIFD